MPNKRASPRGTAGSQAATLRDQVCFFEGRSKDPNRSPACPLAKSAVGCGHKKSLRPWAVRPASCIAPRYARRACAGSRCSQPYRAAVPCLWRVVALSCELWHNSFHPGHRLWAGCHEVLLPEGAPHRTSIMHEPCMCSAPLSLVLNSRFAPTKTYTRADTNTGAQSL